MSGIILHIEGLTQQFKGVLAVDHINMELEKGRIYGLIGTNGAGKSTVVNMISGNLAPTAGEIVFNGKHVEHSDAAHHARAGIARTFQNLRLFGDQTVMDNAVTASQITRRYNLFEMLAYLPRYRREEKEFRENAWEALKESMQLVEDIRGIHRNHPEMTILLIEHDMKVVMNLCEYIYVMASGKMIAEGTPKEIYEHDEVISAYLGGSVRRKKGPASC